MADNKDIKRFKCINFGVCAKADSGEEIKIDAVETLGGIPECPYCHQHTLEEIVDNPIPVKLICIIAGAIILLCGIGYGIYSLMGDSKPTGIKLSSDKLTLTVGEKDLIVPTVEPEGVKATFTYKVTTGETSVKVSSGGEITALKAGDAVVLVKCEENKEIRAKCDITVKDKEGMEKQVSTDNEGTEKVVVEDSIKEEPKTEETKNEPKQNGGNKTSTTSATPKTYHLDWGTYDGPMAGGVPHGFGGSITVSSSHTIDLKKASGETVQVSRGDKIMNVKMDNGRLRQGEIHFADGTRKYISGL